ncbi:hypothetical protein [Borreliella carolinensis]|nr:hypothetical protein [Borreliella carolinensis]WNY65424.1 hypothetical protein QIA46_04475 [Borreliella carolinensis]
MATSKELGFLEQDILNIVIFLHQENREYKGNNNALSGEGVAKVKFLL